MSGANPSRPGRTSPPGHRGRAAVLHLVWHADLYRGVAFRRLCRVPRGHLTLGNPSQRPRTSPTLVWACALTSMTWLLGRGKDGSLTVVHATDTDEVVPTPVIPALDEALRRRLAGAAATLLDLVEFGLSQLVHLIGHEALSPGPECLLCPRLPRRRPATACRAALDAAPASWTIGSRGRPCVAPTSMTDEPV